MPSLSSTDYALGRQIHTTLFGSIYQATDTRTGNQVAFKASKRLAEYTSEDPEAELALLREVGGHRNIVGLLDSRILPDQIECVLEYCPLDLFELYETSLNSPEGKLATAQVQQIFCQVLRALGHLHTRGIAHLDVSLENVLLDHQGEAKLTDFGAAARIRRGNRKPLKFVGKVAYMPAEMYAHTAVDACKVDAWCVGMILFNLLLGFPPYELPVETDTRFKFIKDHGVAELVRAWGVADQLPEGALDLLDSLLAPTSCRMTVLEALQHPWVKEWTASKAEKPVQSLSIMSDSFAVQSSSSSSDSVLWSPSSAVPLTWTDSEPRHSSESSSGSSTTVPMSDTEDNHTHSILMSDDDEEEYTDSGVFAAGGEDPSDDESCMDLDFPSSAGQPQFSDWAREMMREQGLYIIPDGSVRQLKSVVATRLQSEAA
jgi:serine/threonine protein kinase